MVNHLPLAAVVVTAIERDGTMDGPDLDGLRRVLALSTLDVVASGGVRGPTIWPPWPAWRATGGGLAGAIVGTALVEGTVGHGRGGGGVRSVRVIPCLDVDGGRVVKGVHFVDLVDAGDPVELAARYDAEGADELVFLDITASAHGRDTMVDVVARTADQVFIPFTVGGGVRRAEDARRLLRAGADKVALNTAALSEPGLVAHAGRGVRGPVCGGGHRRPEPGRRAGLGGLHPRRPPGDGRDAVLGGAVRGDRGRVRSFSLHGS